LRRDGEKVYSVLGSWIVQGRPCGLAVLEDTGPILTADTAKFVPHIVTTPRHPKLKGRI